MTLCHILLERRGWVNRTKYYSCLVSFYNTTGEVLSVHGTNALVSKPWLTSESSSDEGFVDSMAVVLFCNSMRIIYINTHTHWWTKTFWSVIYSKNDTFFFMTSVSISVSCIKAVEPALSNSFLYIKCDSHK